MMGYLKFVLCSVLSSGRTVHSEVKTFLTKEPSAVTLYKSITTFLNKTISLTGNHLIYAKKGCTDKFSPM